jgi:spermidine synthase
MTSPNRSDAERIFLILAVLCAASGAAALIYQVVWFQLLSLVIGASSVSIGVVLGTFMGGMCIGSLSVWRFVSTRHNPLRVFASIEIGIGLCGLLVLVGMPAINNLYAAIAGTGATGVTGLVLRATVAGVCLLPPTILMGATLPAIARWMQTSPEGVARMGLCYGANIFGAVAGSLLAGFYLLRLFDVAVATYAAVGLNLAVAVSGLILASFSRGSAAKAGSEAAATPHAEPSGPDAVPDPAVKQGAIWPVYLTTALSGMTALAAEVIWTRQLSLLLGATVYTFALVLAVFLFGLGIGSSAGSVASRHLNARLALGACQLLLAVAIVWAAFTVTRFLPYWPLDVTLPTGSAVAMQLDLMRVLWAVLPGALLWGASFPLALAATARRGEDPGKLMGGLYAANTVGAIIGALGTSFVLVVWIGSRHAQQLLIAISIAAALLMLGPALIQRSRVLASRVAAVAIIGTIAAVSILAVPELPGAFVSYGRFMPTRGQNVDVIYQGEGLTASIAVSRQTDGTLTYHNAGKAQASTYPQDMRLQRMLGHMTTLVPENGRSYLVIGLGAGVTAGAVSIDPRAERVVIADIEPLTREAAGQYFREQNFGVVDDPKVELRIDDGRHFLLTTDETFDGITSDPLDPWVKGAAALYTREFWELARSRLNPGGVITVFVQLYEMTEEAVQSEVATFFEVFPNGALFANTWLGEGYDAVLLARADDTPIDVDRIHALLQSPEYSRVATSLRDVGFRNAAELFGTYAGRADDLAPWYEGAVITEDRNLRLQYLAGQGLNLYRADVILDNMLSGPALDPEDYFIASPELMRELDLILNTRQRRF